MLRGVPPPLPAAVLASTPITRSRCCRRLFFRNQTAYIVGRVVNGAHTYPFVVPSSTTPTGELYFDALLMDDDRARAPVLGQSRVFPRRHGSAVGVRRLPARDRCPTRPQPSSTRWSACRKHGKTLFFRDFLHHLKHSTDKFIVAPGIKGLVMTVFTLPSYPYVFKVIRDKIARVEGHRRGAKVKEKYALVKHHDRVGRMTDMLEYSDVAFPRERFTDRAAGRARRPSRLAARDRRRSRASSGTSTSSAG